MRKVFLLLLVALILSACGTTTRIVEEHREVITYSDSTIINQVDSVVWTAREYYRDYGALLDTLTISGQYSEAKAWVDTSLHVLSGSLVSEPKIAKEWHVQYVDRVVERTDTCYITNTVEMPVEVAKYSIPKSYWFFLAYFGMSLVIAGLTIYTKIRGGLR